MSYNPVPTRVWSRVQNPCTYIDSSDNAVYQNVYVPLTRKTMTLFEANYQDKLLSKGNILQYKKNSSNLTKKQKYTQICKGMWTNRTKSYATQTQTYTNPNTSNLLRVNYNNVTSPGTSYINGPYNYTIPYPNGCISTTIKDGGSLLCNTIANPCTDEVIEVSKNLLCYPTTCSDVPGAVQDLCWDPQLNTWYPRQRYVMPTSGTKWPEGYKGFVSAEKPPTPVLTLDSINGNNVTLSWTVTNDDCIPISSYNIYQNGQIYTTVSYTTKTITISIICGSYSFYVISLSNGIESDKSNIVSYTNTISAPFLSLSDDIPNVITLNWNLISNADSYEVYQTGVGLILTTTTNTATISIICGSYSFYVIACINGTDCKSIESNTVNDTNTIYPPTDLTYSTSFDKSTITLNWTSVINADSYKVYQNNVNIQTTTTNTATITGLTYGTNYSFYVTACISGTPCESGPSSSTTYSFPKYTATGTYVTSYNNSYTYLTFTGSGDFCFNDNTANVQVICVGGGGGGGNGYQDNTTQRAGSGGGSGGIGSLSGGITEYQTYSITVGAKGTGLYGQNNPTSSNNGGVSSFGSLINSPGGNSGIPVYNNQTLPGGASGVSTSTASSGLFTSYTTSGTGGFGSGGDGGNDDPNKPLAQPGKSTNPLMPISTSGGLTYSFGGGGGGGYVYAASGYPSGLAGINGIGKGQNPDLNVKVGQPATTLGAGGGGASIYAADDVVGGGGGDGGAGSVVVTFPT